MGAPPIRRVVIRDRAAVLDPGLVAGPASRLALGAVGVSACVQVAGLVQVLLGY
ncbi:MAG: hypothetical protein JOZ41_08700, partial [Chloroflexi bacterium]|nr:hypothetical protein [Chloroflexota bacterium]